MFNKKRRISGETKVKLLGNRGFKKLLAPDYHWNKEN